GVRRRPTKNINACIHGGYAPRRSRRGGADRATSMRRSPIEMGREETFDTRPRIAQDVLAMEVVQLAGIDHQVDVFPALSNASTSRAVCSNGTFVSAVPLRIRRGRAI